MLTKKITTKQRRKRMHAMVEKFKQYVATYPNDACTSDQADETFIKDMLYGLGISIDDGKYSFANGYDRFACTLRMFLATCPEHDTNEPPPGLLLSMAIRSDHALGCPGYYDQPMFATDGVTHQMRLEGAMRAMRQLWEEVTGRGFWHPGYKAPWCAVEPETPK